MKYLCFDLGTRHTGVAFSGMADLPEPLPSIYHQNTKELINHIKKILDKYQPESIILGIPSRGAIKNLAPEVKKQIKKIFSGNIFLQDENFSSQYAEKKMIESGKTLLKRKKQQHSIAACLILESFLEQR